MKQLSMAMKLEAVRPYPLREGYYFRSLCPDSQADIQAWEEICRNGLEGYQDYRKSILKIAQICPERDVLFVCEEETGRPVATLTAYINEHGVGRIHMVAALPQVRGRKLGHAILARGLEKLAAAGAKQAALLTDDFRRAAIKNYLAAGFQPVMVEDNSPDAVPMEQRWQTILAEMQAYESSQGAAP